MAALTWGRQTSAQAADVPIAYTYDIDNSLIYKFNTKDRTRSATRSPPPSTAGTSP
ncbi:hypothetical protein ACFV6D_26395 [Kitasatospora sp. NPDC059812]|uniref:hypothetical protein n=1 Tax=Kitasatospora sp. NPDC059812 TaxID=3346958 RepID=UPI0036681610